MGQINPLTGSILQTSHMQHQRAAAQQLRIAPQAPGSPGRDDDTLELEVEDSDKAHTIDGRDQSSKDQREKKRKHKDGPDEQDEPSGLDLTA